MSLLERVIVAHKCRSMHHYIAMEALNQIGGDQADAWKGMFLQYNADYLEGAKAPDAKFKDFRNHVLHVKEGEWGGARDAAMDWYGRSVEALREKNWKDAAFCLGVLSHYYADVCQPFHTGQTEEEGAIHRAVEWSIVKSVESIFEQLEEDGYPEIEAGDEPGFVADMVLAGAKASNPHYQTFIDHYDIDAGVQDPPSGIDETMFAAVCEMVAYAVSGFGVLITRALDEAAVDAPKTNLTVRGYLASLNIPVRWVTRKLAERGDQKTVEKMYRELQKTGKVIKTLSDDDKLIRKLHARQVLRKPIAELDAQELKPIGSKHVPWEESEDDDVENDLEEDTSDLIEADADEVLEDEVSDENAIEEDVLEEDAADEIEEDIPVNLSRAERRAAKREEKEARKAEKAEAKRQRAEAKRAAKEARQHELDVEDEEDFDDEEIAAEASEDAEYEIEEYIDEDSIEAFAEEIDLDEDAGDNYIHTLEDADPDNEVEEYETGFEDSEEFDAELAELAAIDLDEDDSAVELEAAMAAEQDFAAEQKASNHLRRDRLTLESAIVDAPSIGRKTAKRLAKANIRTVVDLLDADPEAVADELKVGYISAEAIIDWQDQCMLMMEVPGLRTHDVQVLVGAGIRSGEDLAKANAYDVFEAAMDFLSTDEGTRISRDDEDLDESEIEEWIDLAKQEAA